MSALTGSQINQSYQGLIKLADSTTGITSTFQSVQDGLGNNTGLKISNKGLIGENLIGFQKNAVGQYYGVGFGTAGSTPAAGSENKLITQVFYDNGVQSYSAITVNCTTLSASETLEISIYNSRYLDSYGWVPYEKVMSEITVTGTTSTGIKTMVLPSSFTFSGSGPGIYFAVARYNSPSTPVVRFAGPSFTPGSTFLPFLIMQTGPVYNTAGTAASYAQKIVGTAANMNVYTQATFPTTWTSTELDTLTSSSNVASWVPGFLLHTVR